MCASAHICPLHDISFKISTNNYWYRIAQAEKNCSFLKEKKSQHCWIRGFLNFRENTFGPKGTPLRTLFYLWLFLSRHIRMAQKSYLIANQTVKWIYSKLQCGLQGGNPNSSFDFTAKLILSNFKAKDERKSACKLRLHSKKKQNEDQN